MEEALFDGMSDDYEFQDANITLLEDISSDQNLSRIKVTITGVNIESTYTDPNNDEEMRDLLSIPLVEFPEGFDLYLDKIEKIQPIGNTGFYNVTFILSEM